MSYVPTAAKYVRSLALVPSSSHQRRLSSLYAPPAKSSITASTANTAGSLVNIAKVLGFSRNQYILHGLRPRDWTLPATSPSLTPQPLSRWLQSHPHRFRISGMVNSYIRLRQAGKQARWQNKWQSNEKSGYCEGHTDEVYTEGVEPYQLHWDRLGPKCAPPCYNRRPRSLVELC